MRRNDVPTEALKELLSLPQVTWPTFHIASDGVAYAHHGDGRWKRTLLPVYTLADDTPKEQPNG